MKRTFVAHLFLPLLMSGMFSGILPGCASTQKTVSDPCLKRRGAIDIGSGSTKAYAAVVDICSTPKKIVEKILDEKVKISFSEALEQNAEGNIPAEVVTDASAKIATLAENLNKLGLEKIDTVATAAIRKSKNKDAVAQAISTAMAERLRGKSNLNPETFKVRVLPQVEEALLGAASAVVNLPADATAPSGQVIVWDIGGGSMQISALGSNDVFTGELASVTFKNQVIKDVQKKDPNVVKSPNPLNTNKRKQDAKKAVALAKTYADKNLGAFLKIHESKPRWVGIGGVLALSVQKQVDREEQTARTAPGHIPSFTQTALAKTLEKRAARPDEEIESEYRETEITNLALVLGFMQSLKAEKVETVEASLVQGLVLQ